MAVKESTVFEVPVDDNNHIKVAWNGAIIKIMWDDDLSTSFTVSEFARFASDLVSVSDMIATREGQYGTD